MTVILSIRETIHSIHSSRGGACCGFESRALGCSYALVNFFATKEDRALTPTTKTSSTTAVA